MGLSLAENLVDVNVHPSIVVPVVGQRDDEMNVVRFRSSDDVVLKDMRSLIKARQRKTI